MNEGLEALERLVGNKVFISLGRMQGKKQFANDVAVIEKELKRTEQLDVMYSNCVIEATKQKRALDIIVSLFDIKIVGDYLVARRGETCIVYNLKLKQDQELINQLKEVLL